MRCLVCGAKNKARRTACAKCGAPLDNRAPAYGGAARAVRTEWVARGVVEDDEPATVDERAPEEPSVRRQALTLAGVAAAGALCAAAVMAGLGFWDDAGAKGTPLTGEAFADEALVRELAGYDEDGDGYLSGEEAAAVVELSVAGLGISSLDGIEVFANLEVLDAQDNDLAAADLSALTHLRAVNLSGNAIAELSLAGHEALLTLDVSDNGMTALDLTGCGELQRLSCDGNELARLDLTGCCDLTELALDPDQNVTLPISEGFFPDAGLRAALLATAEGADGALTLRERETITSLELHSDDTASLYGIDWICGLTELDVSGCPLTELDAADLPEGLTKLTARGCGLSAVDLEGLEHLTDLDLSDNPLESVALAGLARLTNLSLAGCGLSGELDLTANDRLESLDVRGNGDLVLVRALGNRALEHEGAVLADEGVEVVTSQEPPAEPDGEDGDEKPAEAPDGEGASPDQA
jgi:Leucine-rich repeat (LRR) protein